MKCGGGILYCVYILVKGVIIIICLISFIYISLELVFYRSRRVKRLCQIIPGRHMRPPVYSHSCKVSLAVKIENRFYLPMRQWQCTDVEYQQIFLLL